MRKFASLTVLLALSMGAYAEDLQLKFIRPSNLLGVLMEAQIKPSGFTSGSGAKVARVEGADRGIVPKGVTLTALDSKGILRLEGPEADLVEIKRLISLFDVEPRKVSLSLDLNCPLLNVASTTTTSLLNNRQWHMKDGATDVDLTICPRVNSDNTVTIYLDIQRSDLRQRLVARVKPGQKFYLKLSTSLMFAVPDPDSKEVTWGEPPAGKEVKKAETQGDIDDPETIISLQVKLEDLVQARVEPKKTVHRP